MNPSEKNEQPFLASVLHPTDFSPASNTAFVHALALSLRLQSRLTLLHVGPEHADEVPWHRFPGVRKTLECWGLMKTDSPRSATFDDLALRVKKQALRGRNPTAAILDYLDAHPTDLIVLATHGRDGFPRWIHRAVAEPVARRSHTMTLFVPQGVGGFVSIRNGGVALRRILLPIDRHPHPQTGLDAAARMAGLLGNEPTDITLLNVGDEADVDEILFATEAVAPEGPGWFWSRIQQHGDVVETVRTAAVETQADLIVMVTAGHEGILDALRGSTTEQVLRHAPCPVLAVPAVIPSTPSG